MAYTLRISFYRHHIQYGRRTFSIFFCGETRWAQASCWQITGDGAQAEALAGGLLGTHQSSTA